MSRAFPIYIDDLFFLEKKWLINWVKAQFPDSRIQKFSLKSGFQGICFLDEGRDFSPSDELCLYLRSDNLSFFPSEKQLAFNGEEELQSLVPQFHHFIRAYEHHWQSTLSKICKKSAKLLIDQQFENDRVLELRELLLKANDQSGVKKLLDESDFNLKVRGLYELRTSDLNDKIFPLTKSGDYFVVVEKIDNNTSAFLNSIQSTWQQLGGSKDEGAQSLVRAIYHFPYPIAVSDKRREILYHNRRYSQLKLTSRRLGELKDGDILEDGKEKFQLLIRPIDDEQVLLCFSAADALSLTLKDLTGEELGIVTSSLAHELNNPLGGILAAIDLMMLDKLPPHIEGTMQEMREGVNRCKVLVELFLNFSRKNLNSSSSFKEIKEAVQAAKAMLNSRLLERQAPGHIDFITEQKFGQAFKGNLLTIVLYLILGELITSLSRQELIEEQKGKSFELSVTEAKGELRIHSDQEHMLDPSFVGSRFFAYLLDELNFQMKVNRKEIILTHK